jgi:hypothetical protein
MAAHQRPSSMAHHLRSATSDPQSAERRTKDRAAYHHDPRAMPRSPALMDNGGRDAEGGPSNSSRPPSTDAFVGVTQRQYGLRTGTHQRSANYAEANIAQPCAPSAIRPMLSWALLSTHGMGASTLKYHQFRVCDASYITTSYGALSAHHR